MIFFLYPSYFSFSVCCNGLVSCPSWRLHTDFTLSGQNQHLFFLHNIFFIPAPHVPQFQTCRCQQNFSYKLLGGVYGCELIVNNCFTAAHKIKACLPYTYFVAVIEGIVWLVCVVLVSYVVFMC